MNVHILKEGAVKAYTILANGSKVIVALYGPGDHFPASFDNQKVAISMFYYETLCDSSVTSYNPDEPQDAVELLQTIETNLPQLYAYSLLHTYALVQMDSPTKLVHILRYLSMKFGTALVSKYYTKIALRLTQQDISELCNMSRETTNIELTKLKQKGTLLERSKYYSVHLAKLNALIGDDIDVDVGTTI